MQVGGLTEPVPELSAADHVPTPGAALDALWAVVPELAAGGPLTEMVGALAERLPDFEIGG